MQVQQKSQIVDATGKVIEEQVVKDGHRVRVPLHLCDANRRDIVIAAFPATDAARHRPGFVVLTDADRQRREKLYGDYDQVLASRYKTPPPSPVLPTELMNPAEVRAAKPATPVSAASVPAAATSGDLAAAYARRDAALERRWRGAQ